MFARHIRSPGSLELKECFEHLFDQLKTGRKSACTAIARVNAIEAAIWLKQWLTKVVARRFPNP